MENLINVFKKKYLFLICLNLILLISTSCYNTPINPDETPILSVTPKNLDFSKEITNLDFYITNTGDGVLTWNIECDKSWLSVSSPNGSNSSNESKTITVTIDREGLDPGLHDGKIIINSNSDKEWIEVSMEVVDEPILSVTPTNLDFSKDISNLNFVITNTGKDILEWNIECDNSWLSVSSANGSNSSNKSTTVTVNVTRTGLNTGPHTGKITIHSNGGDKSINASMKVVGESVLSVAPKFLDFSNKFTNLDFYIINTGDDTLKWKIQCSEPWLSVSLINGLNGRNDEITITATITRSGLEPGVYNGIIAIISNGGECSINVSMEVPYIESDFRIGIQLSDIGTTGSQAGEARYSRWASETNTWSDWASDANNYDPDAIRIKVEKKSGEANIILKDRDIQLGIQLTDQNGSGTGPEVFTPWISESGGWSEWALDSNGKDFDAIRIKINTRYKKDLVIKDLRIGIQLADNAGKNQSGDPRYTPWLLADQGGWSELAGDENYRDPDAVRIKLEIRK